MGGSIDNSQALFHHGPGQTPPQRPHRPLRALCLLREPARTAALT